MSLDFLYLDEPDMIKAGVMDMKRCVQSMDDMFQVMGHPHSEYSWNIYNNTGSYTSRLL